MAEFFSDYQEIIFYIVAGIISLIVYKIIKKIIALVLGILLIGLGIYFTPGAYDKVKAKVEKTGILNKKTN